MTNYNFAKYTDWIDEKDITYGPCGPCFPPKAALVQYMPDPETISPKRVTFTPQDKIPPKEPYKTCNICFEAIADAVLEPCSHNTFCSMCIHELNKPLACPLCRVPVTYVTILKPHNFT